MSRLQRFALNVESKFYGVSFFVSSSELITAYATCKGLSGLRILGLAFFNLMSQASFNHIFFIYFFVH